MNNDSNRKINPLITIICLVIGISSISYYFIHKYIIVPNKIFSQQQEDIKKAQEVRTPKAEALAKLEIANTRVEKEAKALDFLVSQAQIQKNTISNIEIKYKSTQKLIDTKVDVLFNKPTTKPALKIVFKDTTLDDNINIARKELQAVMDSWKRVLDKYNAEVKTTSKVSESSIALSDLISTTQKNTDVVKSFIQDLKIIVDTLTITNSNLTQAQINEYKSVVNNALSDIQKIDSSIESISANNETKNSISIVTPIQIQNQQQTLDQAKSDLAVAQAEAVAVEAIDPILTTPVDVTPDATPPSAKITNLTSGETVSYTVTVSAFATDPSGIEKVEFYSNDVLIGVDTTSQYSIVWDTTNTPDGTYELSAKAYDQTGNTTISKLVSIIVSNDEESSTDTSGGPPDPELIEGSNRITP